MHELAAISRPRPGAPAPTPCSASRSTRRDPARGALLQKARELGAAIETQLLFFDLEWNQVPDERADELLADAGARLLPPTTCATCAATAPTSSRSPRSACSRRPNVTGGSAFQRLFTEQTSALEVPLPDRDEPASLEEGLVAAPGPRPRAARARPPRP